MSDGQPVPKWRVAVKDAEASAGPTLNMEVYGNTMEAAQDQALDAWARQYGERPGNPFVEITRIE